MDAITPDTTGSAASEMADDFITVALQPDTALESSITPQELLEFLEADTADVPVDPQFKERLRQQLWQMVQQQALRLRAATTAEKRQTGVGLATAPKAAQLCDSTPIEF